MNSPVGWSVDEEVGWERPNSSGRGVVGNVHGQLVVPSSLCIRQRQHIAPSNSRKKNAEIKREFLKSYGCSSMAAGLSL